MSVTDTEAAMNCLAESSSRDGAPLPACPPGVPRVTILRAVIPPHARLELHGHPVVNAGLEVRGALAAAADPGMPRTILAGKGIFEMVGTLQYGGNRGGVQTAQAVFYAGSEGLPLSEKPARTLYPQRFVNR